MVQRIALPLDSNGQLKKVPRPSLPKYGIYLILFNEEIVRVGESSSGADRIVKGFKEPLRRILRGKDRKNYLAYHWRTEFPNLTVHADYFEIPQNPFSDSHLRRALEAEVTFQLRVAKKSWPRCMSEIHFLERCRKDSRIIAQTTEILENYGHEYDDSV